MDREPAEVDGGWLLQDMDDVGVPPTPSCRRELHQGPQVPKRLQNCELHYSSRAQLLPAHQDCCVNQTMLFVSSLIFLKAYKKKHIVPPFLVWQMPCVTTRT
jgi:hypothetical protein